MGLKLARFGIDGQRAEALGDFLLEEGALAASVEETDDTDPLFAEPGMVLDRLWHRSRVLAHFDSTIPEGLAERVAEHFGHEAAAGMSVEDVPETDWVRATQDQFEPIEAAPGLWIVPSWHEPRPGALNIRIDPGLAFGTGSHATTRLCLQWLAGQDLTGRSVLDYGCGSGILAIAAKLLGAAGAIGVDIDPQAVESTLANAAANGVDMKAFVPGAEAVVPADVVVANILANPLRELAPLLAAAVRPGGRLALAGLLDEQAEDVAAFYRPWIDMKAVASLEGWTLLAGTR